MLTELIFNNETWYHSVLNFRGCYPFLCCLFSPREKAEIYTVYVFNFFCVQTELTFYYFATNYSSKVVVLV